MKKDKLIILVNKEGNYSTSIENSLVFFRRSLNKKKKMLRVRRYHVKNRKKRCQLERSIG
ncbi:MAG TPA: hypothetical protein VN854_00855 [Mycoplasmatales bacterium]|jgi:hypothetical protein|nr:hypothetical protein [Mycoplasmatales bacterium]